MAGFEEGIGGCQPFCEHRHCLNDKDTFRFQSILSSFPMEFLRWAFKINKK